MSVFINGKPVAEALSVAPDGLKLPAWQGCHVLQADEVFLLNDHPRSLDGRYFGVMRVSDLEGTARLLLGPLW
jgi:type IV secretory pathway protease TraF